MQDRHLQKKREVDCALNIATKLHKYVNNEETIQDLKADLEFEANRLKKAPSGPETLAAIGYVQKKNFFHKLEWGFFLSRISYKIVFLFYCSRQMATFLGPFFGELNTCRSISPSISNLSCSSGKEYLKKKRQF